MKRKRILVPWSGGFDSTYLIHTLLEKGHNVTAVYINLLNNSLKTKAEHRAISRILKATNSFSGYPGKFQMFGSFKELKIELADCGLDLSQAYIWTTILGALNFQGDEINFGYILEDHALSWEKEIKTLFRASESFKTYIKKSVKIEFPLKKTDKTSIMSDYRYDPRLKRLRTLCFTCEYPSESLAPCGECKSCKKAGSLKDEDEECQDLAASLIEKLETPKAKKNARKSKLLDIPRAVLGPEKSALGRLPIGTNSRSKGRRHLR